MKKLCRINLRSSNYLKRTPELTGDGVRCLDGLRTVYSLIGGRRFGISGNLFCKQNISIVKTLLNAEKLFSYSKRVTVTSSEVHGVVGRIARNGTETSVGTTIMIMMMFVIYSV